jgi:hypothetical protein
LLSKAAVLKKRHANVQSARQTNLQSNVVAISVKSLLNVLVKNCSIIHPVTQASTPGPTILVILTIVHMQVLIALRAHAVGSTRLHAAAAVTHHLPQAVTHHHRAHANTSLQTLHAAASTHTDTKIITTHARPTKRRLINLNHALTRRSLWFKQRRRFPRRSQRLL